MHFNHLTVTYYRDPLYGVPGGIRTHGPQIRNLVLYPAELREPTDTLPHRPAVRGEGCGTRAHGERDTPPSACPPSPCQPRYAEVNRRDFSVRRSASNLPPLWGERVLS